MEAPIRYSLLGMQVSPLHYRRWQVFRSSRRGFLSLLLFMSLLFVTLAADFVANDKPIIMQHEGQFYFPIFQTYTEAQLGGDFETEAEYRDPYVQQLIAESGGWMLWPPIRYSYQTINYDVAVPTPAPPSGENWLGTDDQGRDVLARLIYGLRLSMLFALCMTVGVLFIGIATGAVQGYFGGWTDILMQRFIEIWSGLPILYLLIILSSIFAPGFLVLLFLLLVFSWMGLSDIVRAEFLKVRSYDYVKAARALGVGNLAIMARHVLPNAMVATLTFLPFIFTGAITSLTALDYLGLGMPPGQPSLGELLVQGKSNLQAPWLGLTAFVTLSVVLTLVVFIGEAVRDAFDPRTTVEGDRHG